MKLLIILIKQKIAETCKAIHKMLIKPKISINQG